MDACPNEILSLIFAETCTDDGLTGRSLSLVSRRIRDASRRYALQSVALHGSHQLFAFASLLDKANPEDRGTLRHLYITDRRRAWVEYLPGQDRDAWFFQYIHEQPHMSRSTRKHSFSAILRILTTVAPTLETLTLLLFDRYTEQPLSHPTVSLPKLRELTVHGSSLTHTGMQAESEFVQCLALRRLHVIQDFELRGSMPKAVARLAPLLTHLRISRLVTNRISSGDLVHGLEHMLQQDDLASTGFPPTLQCVLIQMLQQGPHDQAGQGGAVRVLASVMAQLLKHVAMRDVRGRIVLLKPSVAAWDAVGMLIGEGSDVQFYMTIKAAWLERVVGAESTVWEVEPSSILASYGYSAEG
ncbi:hypothetical protein V8D89_002747 [Ganoderma adspersum]